MITRYRNANANLRTQLQRIIKRAGLKSWLRLFQNLRATRETELAEEWPMHVVVQWIGNSEAVATKHYLQVTDEHFERASASEAVQNPVQQPAATSRTPPQAETAESEKPYVCSSLRDSATPCEPMETSLLGLAGFEPATNRL